MNMIIEEYIKNHLEYDNGELYWKDRIGRGKRFNDRKAGWYDNKGYKRVCVKGRDIPAHRIVFFIHHGYWPNYTDHINRIKHDNRIENLRECTNAQNLWNASSTNNKSKYGRGVSWHKEKKKYVARIRINCKTIHLGYFDDSDLAQLVASEARDKYYGEFNYDY